MLRRFLQNHVLANLVFIIVILGGVFAYLQLPRQQFPSINFNWIEVFTVMPGAAAEDVEKRVTTPIEDAIRGLNDIDYVISVSRENISTMIIRFEDIDAATFAKRAADVRREIQNIEDKFPDETESPIVRELTSSNSYPTMYLFVASVEYDENLLRNSERIKKDLEQLPGIDEVSPIGMSDPEIQVRFRPDLLDQYGVNPTDLSDTIRSNFRDTAAGDTRVGQQNWLVRTIGTDNDPGYLASMPVLTAQGEVPLGALASIERRRSDPTALATYAYQPGVLMAISKEYGVNTLDLVEQVKVYIQQANQLSAETGIELRLADDQTAVTRDAISVMETNALIGLVMVLLVSWLFLGFKTALLISIAIPFILSGTFWVLYLYGETLNTMALLGVVIALGMLVDDAVVVVEAIYYRVQRGMETSMAAVAGLREVFAPVTASTLTTVAAFLPLIAMPGILGKFMFAVPFVVTVALAVSLLEAYWMLPAHIIASNLQSNPQRRSEQIRTQALRKIRLVYGQWLVKALRYRVWVYSLLMLAVTGCVLAVMANLIKSDFFASDPMKLFYVNVEMPAGTTLQRTAEELRQIEEMTRDVIRPDELRSIVAYSGQLFTETTPQFGPQFGQLIVSLDPENKAARLPNVLVDLLEPQMQRLTAPVKVDFIRMEGGPPAEKPISAKIKGDDFAALRAAADDLLQIMASIDGVKDISIDDASGQNELQLKLRYNVIRDLGLNPVDIGRTVSLMVDGEVVTDFQDSGEEVSIRVLVEREQWNTIDELLQVNIQLPDTGGRTLQAIPLSELVEVTKTSGLARIRHYDFRRTIEIQADIDKSKLDVVQANQLIIAAWDEVASQHPQVTLDFSGLFDDINESLVALIQLFLLGALIIYAILGTQFRSYFQPLIILCTVLLALIGVVIGFLINRNPMSLYSLYGVVALMGIAVNSAIVLLSTANNLRDQGIAPIRAIVYAARRRVIPIMITSLTTVAGLFSLAVGVGGYSLLWGPVASAIVWGLSISTLLTLFVIPLLYTQFNRHPVKQAAQSTIEPLDYVEHTANIRQQP